MTLKFNADQLLYNTTEGDCFLYQLEPDDKTKQRMNEIKLTIRNKIRSAFKDAHSLLETSGLKVLSERYQFSMEDFSLFSENQSDAVEAFKSVNPKFRSQGSKVYGTLNSPAQTPPQEMDIDDGVYLPMSLFNDQGPVIAKNIFFKIVDTALKDLCREQGWEFKQKNTCARINIPGEPLHFDTPLYAIPDKKHTAMTASMESFDTASLSFAEIVLDPSEVYLAIRDETHWKASDPKVVSDWFTDEIECHKSKLTRACRYLKAWRDHNWPDGPISSLALMVCAVKTFNTPGVKPSNQSEALLEVAARLPDQLREGVILPVNGEPIYPRPQDTAYQADAIAKAEEFKEQIHTALLSAFSPNESLAAFKAVFGNRIPNNASLISLNSNPVREAPAIRQASPEKNIPKQAISG